MFRVSLARERGGGMPGREGGRYSIWGVSGPAGAVARCGLCMWCQGRPPFLWNIPLLQTDSYAHAAKLQTNSVHSEPLGSLSHVLPVCILTCWFRFAFKRSLSAVFFICTYILFWSVSVLKVTLDSPLQVGHLSQVKHFPLFLLKKI